MTNAQNYFNQGSHAVDLDNYAFRIDHNLTDSQKVFIRYSDRYDDDVPAVLFPTAITVAEGRIIQKDYMRNFVGSYTNTLSPTTVLNVRAGFARSLYYYYNQGLGFQASSLGLPAAIDTGGYLAMFPNISTSGYVSLGNSDHRKNAFMTYSLLAGITSVKGPHTIKYGWEGRMIRVNGHEYRSTSGSYSFTAALPRDQPEYRQCHGRQRLCLAAAGHGEQRQPDSELQRCLHAEFLSCDIPAGRYSRFAAPYSEPGVAL